jgi:hypothetical protein
MKGVYIVLNQNQLAMTHEVLKYVYDVENLNQEYNLESLWMTNSTSRGRQVTNTPQICAAELQETKMQIEVSQTKR